MSVWVYSRPLGLGGWGGGLPRSEEWMGGEIKRDRTNVIVSPTLPLPSCFELKTKRLKFELSITLGSYVPSVIGCEEIVTY